MENNININDVNDITEFDSAAYLKEIEEETRRASQDFIDIVSEMDLLSVVLRAHLLVENEITTLLEKELKNPKEYLKNKTFYQKTSLGFAIGSLTKDEKGMIGSLNDIRNQYGHDVNYRVSEKEVTDFVNTFNSPLKKQYSKRYQGKEKPHYEIRFRYALCLLWLHLRNKNALYEFNNLLERSAKEREIIDRVLLSGETF